MHGIWLEVKGWLFIAPLKQDGPIEVLDIGCGYGTWPNALGMDANHYGHQGADRHVALEDRFKVSDRLR